MRRIAALTVLTACASSAPPPPKPAAAPPPPPRRPALDVDTAALAAWTDRALGGHVPSAVIAIVDADGIRWQHAIGSRDAKGGPPPDQTTVYRIGSITKVLTGTALLQLRDQGRLTLDEPVAKWIPELAGRLSASEPAVTLRHLVTHTAGVPGLGDGSAPWWEQTPPTEAQIVRAADVPLAFAPGTQSTYSNMGMALAGIVLARASGEPYRAYMAKHVLGPLGMRTAAWDRERVPVERLAIGVDASGTVDAPHWRLGAYDSIGGLYASLEDMVGLARLAVGRAPDVLMPATLAEALADDPLPGEHGVAWHSGTLDGVALAGHTGSTLDYSASFVVARERGLAAIILAAGPRHELTDCAAIMLAIAVATGKPPRGCGVEPAAPAP